MVRSRARSIPLRLMGVFVATVLVVAACGGDDADSNGAGGDGADDGGEPQRIELGLSGGSLAFYGFFAADSLGYYDDEGLEVNITTTGGSSEAAQQLVADNFDIAMGVPDAMLAAMLEEDICPFFTYFTSEFRDWVVPVDSSIQSVADVRGTNLGVSNLQGGEVPLVRYLLEQEGIDPESDVSIIEASDQPPAIQTALEQERIDSFAGSKTHSIAISAAGFEIRSILPETFGAGLPVEGLLAHPKHCGDDELLTKVGRATAKGILFCQTSVDACIEAIGQDAPELVEDRALAEETIQQYIGFSTPPEEDGRLYFSPTTLDGWEQYLGIYSTGDDPVIEDPDSIDLSSLVIEDLRDPINDFDYDAVVEEANNYGG